MAAYNWSTLVNNSLLLFNPFADQLVFDDPAISAAAVQLGSNGADWTFSYGGKTVRLSIAPTALTRGNVVFADGSVLLVGDNATGTTNDYLDNTLAGGAGRACQPHHWQRARQRAERSDGRRRARWRYARVGRLGASVGPLAPLCQATAA